MENNPLNQKPALKLGTLVITSGVAAQVEPADVFYHMLMHSQGVWGEVSEADAKINDEALMEGDRILSAYTSRTGVKFWVITEWDRSYTTALLPDEY